MIGAAGLLSFAVALTVAGRLSAVIPYGLADWRSRADDVDSARAVSLRPLLEKAVRKFAKITWLLGHWR